MVTCWCALVCVCAMARTSRKRPAAAVCKRPAARQARLPQSKGAKTKHKRAQRSVEQRILRNAAKHAASAPTSWWGRRLVTNLAATVLRVETSVESVQQTASEAHTMATESQQDISELREIVITTRALAIGNNNRLNAVEDATPGVYHGKGFYFLKK